jgi:hypothetical protein
MLPVLAPDGQVQPTWGISSALRVRLLAASLRLGHARGRSDHHHGVERAKSATIR